MVHPKVWGADAWYFMHSLRQHFLPEHVSKYKQIYRSIRWILPCIKCRTNYNKDLNQNRLRNIVNSQSLKRWVRRMNNLTNQKTGAPPIGNYRLPEKLNHKRIIRFLRIARDDAGGDPKRMVVINRIRRLLTTVLPCPICRERFSNNKVPNFRKFFNIMQRKH